MSVGRCFPLLGLGTFGERLDACGNVVYEYMSTTSSNIRRRREDQRDMALASSVGGVTSRFCLGLNLDLGLLFYFS